jgi:hypothetical protein
MHAVQSASNTPVVPCTEERMLYRVLVLAVVPYFSFHFFLSPGLSIVS